MLSIVKLILNVRTSDYRKLRNCNAFHSVVRVRFGVDTGKLFI
jgi:hypothetical protein